MRRAAPEGVVLIHMVPPFFAVAKEHIRMVAVAKEAYIWVQIIPDVIAKLELGRSNFHTDVCMRNAHFRANKAV